MKPLHTPAGAQLLAMPKCTRPAHRECAEPEWFGIVTVADSLDPADVIRYSRCPLCGGVVEIG